MTTKQSPQMGATDSLDRSASISATSRLYVVVRSDLPPGAQAAQACHTLRAFVERHPELERAWFLTSNNLVVLNVPDEAALDRLVRAARERDIPYAVFLEPDFAGSLTGVALAPSARSMLRKLPLALSA